MTARLSPSKSTSACCSPIESDERENILLLLPLRVMLCLAMQPKRTGTGDAHAAVWTLEQPRGVGLFRAKRTLVSSALLPRADERHLLRHLECNAERDMEPLHARFSPTGRTAGPRGVFLLSDQGEVALDTKLVSYAAFLFSETGCMCLETVHVVRGRTSLDGNCAHRSGHATSHE